MRPDVAANGLTVANQKLWSRLTSNTQEKMEVFEYVGVNLEGNFTARFAINNFPIDLHLSQLYLY